MVELTERAHEVRETFRQETVRHELAYLAEGQAGPILVHIIEADDLDQASRAVEEHPLPIDLEHRQVMTQVLGTPVSAECLFSMTIDQV
jgi:hypothetical protein